MAILASETVILITVHILMFIATLHDTAWTVTVLALLQENVNEHIQNVLYNLHLTNLGLCAQFFFPLCLSLIVAMIHCKNHQSAGHSQALTLMRHFALTIYG